MFGIGIIGCGKIAQVRHLPEYRENPEAKIYGLYDLNEDQNADFLETGLARNHANQYKLHCM